MTEYFNELCIGCLYEAEFDPHVLSVKRQLDALGYVYKLHCHNAITYNTPSYRLSALCTATGEPKIWNSNICRTPEECLALAKCVDLVTRDLHHNTHMV